MVHTGQTFRDLHEQEASFIMPNPWDVGSARILTVLGFKALATTSSGMAFALGLKDGAVSPDAVLRHCKELVDATPLPVSADLEKGFGDSPQSVADTIAAAAEAGLSGCSIEDYSGNPHDPIFEFELAVERIRAASEASRALSHDFVLTARCENLLWDRPGLDGVIKRLLAYEAAGADVLYAPGLHDLDSIRMVCNAVTRPVNVVVERPGKPFTVGELTEAGVKRISIGAILARLAYGALANAGREMLTCETFNFSLNAMDYDELESMFSGKPEDT